MNDIILLYSAIVKAQTLIFFSNSIKSDEVYFLKCWTILSMQFILLAEVASNFTERFSECIGIEFKSFGKLQGQTSIYFYFITFNLL